MLSHLLLFAAGVGATEIQKCVAHAMLKDVSINKTQMSLLLVDFIFIQSKT